MNRMRILIIGRELDQYDYFATAIAKRACEAVAVSSAGDGLALIDDVDACLLEITSSSVDAVSAIRSVRAKSDLPLVVIASVVSSDACAEALLAGADDYLSRAVNIDELIARIRALLRRHRP